MNPCRFARRRIRFAVAFSVLLAVASAAAASGSEPEVVKGTVSKFRPGIITLTNVRFPDGTLSDRDVMVIVKKGTSYFDGPHRTTKEEIEPGLTVLVKCVPAGTGREAILVRIVGRPAR